MSGIGLLNEGPLHAALKMWYAQPEDRFEVTVEGFVIDIVRDGLVLEIQTGNVASIKSKLANLVRSPGAIDLSDSPELRIGHDC